MAHAVRKFRVKYSSVESFCREYEKNLRFGGLFIATAQPATIHSVLELVLVLPEFDEDFSLRGEVVLVQDEATAWALEQKPGMAVQVIRDDQIRLDELKEKLARIEIYRTLLGLKAPSAAPASRPPAPEPVEEVMLGAARPAAARPEEPSPKVQFKKVSPEPAAKPKPPPAPQPAPQPAPEFAAPARPQAGPTDKTASRDLLKGEAIDFLRRAVGAEEIAARPLRQEMKAPAVPAERVRRAFSDEEKKRLEPVSQFVGLLVKAMLRSGYYAPDHPESRKAKEGLYQSLGAAMQDDSEIGLISRSTTEATDILVSGALDEPVSLRSVFTASSAEMFLPKLREYFERKGLVSFSIKAGIPPDHFNSFVDIMNDPAVDKEGASEVGHLLTAALVRENILEISTVFQDDMIKLGLKLPWRVEMAIQRLAKDLRTVPMFQNLSADQLSKLKAHIIEDILRPLRQPHLLKDMVVNCYLIARQVEGLKAEELEQTLIEHFPMTILLPTSEFVFAEMKALKAELDQKPDSVLLQERLGGIKRILKVISERVLKEEIAGGEAFLENLFFQEVLSLDELPQAVRDRINTLRLAQAFAQNPTYYAGKFAECRAPEDYRLFLRFWRRILPEILDNRDYPNLYFLCAALRDAKKRDPEQLARLRGEVKDEVEHVWAGHYANLKEIFLTEKKETRAGLDEVVTMLGASGLELMVQVLSESKDRWVRKGAIDALIRMGAPARKHIRAILDDPGQPWALQRSALFILSQLASPPAGAPPAGAEPAAEKEDQARFERFLRHSQPQLREEAIVSLFRLLGPRALPKLTAAMDDPDPRVRRRALACLAALPTLSADLAGRVASHLRPEEGKTEEDMVKVQAAKVLAQLGNVPVNADEDAEAVLLSLLAAGAGWAQKLLSKFREETGESETVKLVALDTLGKIGTEKSFSLLERLAKTAAGKLLSKIQDTQKQIELRTQK